MRSLTSIIGISFIGVLCVATAQAQFPPDDNISIGLESNPVEISLDPGGAPWDKVIDNQMPNVAWADDLYDFSVTPPSEFGLLTVIQLEEWIKISGRLSWTDWHEEILNSPGWVWDQGGFGLPGVSGPFLEVRKPGETGFVIPDGNLIFATDTTVDFFFDPLPVGTEIHIVKRLVFQGFIPGFNDNDLYFGPLTIREFPTPEPATLLLFSIGGLVWLRRR